MKSITTQLQDLFATRQFQACGLYAFTLVSGGSLYYASGDVDIKVGSQVYTAGGTTGPFFDRTDNKAKMHQKVGVQVDTLSFDVIPGGSQVQGTSFLSAVRQGIFDGATMVYSGAYWPKGSWTSPVIPTGTIDKFEGLVAEVDVGRSLATFTVNSFLDLLNQNMPRNLFQSGCVNTLFDASCTLSQSSFLTTGTASSGSTASVIHATLSQASGYFNLGKITFTSGVNSGVSRSIGLYTNGSPSVVSLSMPFPNAPTAGDTFDIFPGCDKTQLTCGNKFNNLTHFRGFPFIPEVSTAA